TAGKFFGRGFFWLTRRHWFGGRGCFGGFLRNTVRGMVTAREKRVRNAVYQARWRARRDELARTHPEGSERRLLGAGGGWGRVADGDRVALADKLADLAMAHLRRSQELALLARRVRAGERGAGR